MSTLRSCRPIAVVLLLLLWPTLGRAQSAPPAGVVTGLQGQATLVRPVIAQPIPLRFKDDLFLRDQIETRQNSLVRVLLGGKALVTIRELSSFFITEEPGRAAVNLKSGKLAVGVAKSLLRPGEAIEIHTPNAIAAVRGSLLIASVVTSGGVPQSFFTALDASLPITVTPLGGGGAPVSLQVNQAVGVSGLGANTVVGPVQAVTPEVARREGQTASAPRSADPQSTVSPMAAEISAAKFQEATLLASLVAGPSTATQPSSGPAPSDSALTSATQTQLLQESGSTLSVASQTAVQSTPPPPSTSSLGVNASATEQEVQSGTSGSEATGGTGSTSGGTTGGETGGTGGAGGTGSTGGTGSSGGTGETGSAGGTGGSSGGTGGTGGTGGSGGAGGQTVISGQNLALAANQTLKTFSGVTTSTDPSPAVAVTNSTVTGQGNLIVAEPGSTTSLAGPLFDVTGSTISSVGSMVRFTGGSLTSTTTSPFLSLDPTSVTSGQQVLLLEQGFSLSLAGPLFAAVSTTMQVGDPNTFAASFMNVFDGATVSSTGTAPLLSFDASSVDTAGALVSIRRSASVGSPSRVTLAGPLFLATNGSSFNTTSLAFGPTFGVAGTSCCSAFTLSQGAQLTSTTGAPLIELSGSSLNAGPDLQSGGAVFSISDTVTGFPAAELVAPSSMSLAGPLLRAEAGSTISALSHLLSVGRSSLTSTSPSALLQIVDSTVSLGGLDPISNTIVNGQVLNLFGGTTSPSTLTLQGPLFSSTNSELSTTGVMFGVLDGATLTSSTQNPLISISGGAALAAVSGTGNNFIAVSSGSLGLPPTVSLAGPLLSASSATLRNGNGASNIFSFLFVGDSSKVTSTSDAPFLAFDGTVVDSSANILSLRRSLSTANPTRLTLAGPLFAALNGSSFNTTSLGQGSACCDGFGIRQAAELIGTGTAPLIQLSGSTFSAGPDAQSGGNFFGLSDNSINGPVTAPAKVLLAGPLLTASGSSINALFNLLSIVRSSFTSTTLDPLVDLSGDTVALGGVDPFTGANASSRAILVTASGTVPASLSLQGPLLRSTDSTITSGQEILGVFNGATLSDSGTSPLVTISGGSATAGTAIPAGSGGGFFSFASAVGNPAPSVNLAGPLLSAVNTTLKNGNQATNTHSFMFIGDSATVASTSGEPFASFDSVNVTSSGGFVTLRRSLSSALPTSLTLAGPLFAATDSSFSLVSAAFGSACCTTFFIGQGAQLTSNGTGALVQLTNSSLNAGPDPVAGGGNIVSVADTGACCGETNLLVAPSKVALAGPLASATNSNVSALFGLLGITRSALLSSTATPFIELSGTTLTLGGVNPFVNVQTAGRLLTLVSSGTSGTVGSPASLTLNGAGPFLRATNSVLSASSDALGIFNGATLASAATVPLLQLNGGALTTQSAGGGGGYLLQVGGTGGPTGTAPSSAQLGGALLSATGSLNLSGGLLGVFSGSQVTTLALADPFVLVSGGTHVLAGNPNTGLGFAMFSLSGRSETTALDAQTGLLLGTDRPVQGALQLDGTRPLATPLLETSGATVSGQKVLRIDNALLEATAPLLNLRPNGSTQSVLTSTGSNALDLTFQTRVSALGSSLIRLDNSILNVVNGSLVNVNASKLTVGGDLATLVNGATLSVLNGPLITVAGSGLASVAGGLINFGGTGGNTVNITNNLCPCSLFGGVPVALQNGALATNVQITSPIKNPALGTLNLSPNAALAVVNGAGSKLIVGPQ